MKRFYVLAMLASLQTIISDEMAQGQSSTASHVVISEVQVGGTLVDDEFVELYNPTNSAISLSGWRLRRKTSTGTGTHSRVGFWRDREHRCAWILSYCAPGS